MSESDQHESDAALAQRSRELFAAQVANLDARTQSRLNQARQAALDAARGKSQAWGGSRWLLPAGSAAALALVAVTTLQIMRPGADLPAIESTNTVTGSVDDVDILTSSDELEMLQHMDFYAWLETQQDDLASAGASVSEAG